MAEIRKYNPDAGDGIGRLVREALGETIRPTEPGEPAKPVESADPEEEPEEAGPGRFGSWDGSGPTFQF